MVPSAQFFSWYLSFKQQVQEICMLLYKNRSVLKFSNYFSMKFLWCIVKLLFWKYLQFIFIPIMHLSTPLFGGKSGSSWHGKVEECTIYPYMLWIPGLTGFFISHSCSQHRFLHALWFFKAVKVLGEAVLHCKLICIPTILYSESFHSTVSLGLFYTGASCSHVIHVQLCWHDRRE
jgi:hypothetical protein